MLPNYQLSGVPWDAPSYASPDELRTGDGEPLPDRLRNEIRRQLQRLKLLLELIGTVEAECDAIVKADKPASEADRKIRALAKLKGIGPEIATVLYNEVFYRQFANRRDIAGYVGLTLPPCSASHSA
jgi:transposase